MAKSSLSVFKKGDDFLKHYLKCKRKLNWKKHTLKHSTKAEYSMCIVTNVIWICYGKQFCW